MQKVFLIILFIIGISFPFSSYADIDTNVSIEYFKGTVIDTVQDEHSAISYVTRLDSGKVIELDSYGDILPVGSRVYVEYFTDENVYNFVTIQRTPTILWVFGLFVLCIFIFTHKKGLRSLLSLGLSFVLLILGLVPLLMRGYDPIVVSLVFGLCVLFLGIFVTHGFNRQSLVSFLGSGLSILVAFLVLVFISKTSYLTGVVDDHTQFLSYQTGSIVDFVRLFMAAVIIGTLGVLDDITITQVAVVRELSEVSKLSKHQIFKKALNVGKDHISSLVNTLIFAYVGATLPLIMFISLLEIPFLVLISQEFIFIEIMRSLVGAIALIVAVPVTTWLASYVFLETIKKDEEIVETCAHCHQ